MSSTAGDESAGGLEGALLAHEVDGLFVEADAGRGLRAGVVRVSWTALVASALFCACCGRRRATPFDHGLVGALQACAVEGRRGWRIRGAGRWASAVWLSPALPFLAAARRVGLVLERLVDGDVTGVGAVEEVVDAQRRERAAGVLTEGDLDVGRVGRRR